MSTEETNRLNMNNTPSEGQIPPVDAPATPVEPMDSSNSSDTQNGPRPLTPREREIARACARANPALGSAVPRLLATALAASQEWSIENIWHALFTRDLSQEENADTAMQIVLMTGMVMPDSVSQEDAERYGLTREDMDRLMDEFTSNERALENSVMLVNGMAYQFTKVLGKLIGIEDDDEAMRHTFEQVLRDEALRDTLIEDSVPTIAQALMLERKGVEWRGFGPSVMDGCVRRLVVAKAMAEFQMEEQEED